MSRSNPTVSNSPANRFFEWAAEKGVLQYYDKEAKENISIKLPFSFMVLDEVSQVGGGVKIQGKYEGYWSNAVKNLDTQIITVKSKQGIVAQGLYASLKDRKGLHYVKGLYIAYHGSNGLEIGYLKFKGSSLGAWFDFTKIIKNIYKGAITIKSKSDVIEGDKGNYYVPVFAHKAEISPESEKEAIALDEQVQEYLKAYFSHKGTEEPTAEDFAEPQTRAARAGVNATQASADYEEEEDLDQIPF